MPKTALEQWDETNANNSDIGGTNIAEGCAPSGINNAIREEMAQVAAWLGDDTLASAATTDLGSVPGRYVGVTGTTTITGLGTIKAGTIKYVKFAGILTLTHNSTSLILPGATSVTTAAGDTAIFVSEGSGSWRCLSYTRAASIPGSYVLYPSQSSASTSYEFNDIPPDVKAVTMILNGFSNNGNSALAQLGTAAGWKTTGYVGSRLSATDVVALATAVDDGGVFVAGSADGALYSGAITFRRISSGNWVFVGSTARSDAVSYSAPTGIVNITDELTRIRITSTGARDAGSVTVSYEM